MKQHDKALRVIVDKVRDHEAAENYCVDNQPPHVPGEVRKSLFTDLLEIYFTHADAEVQKRATSILERHAPSLDVVGTLKLLPPTLPLRIVTPWLTKALQDGVHQSRHTSVSKQLYKMENLRTLFKNAQLKKR